ncbi:MAG: substrate-binding domain-containing protein [Pseudomonadota bacterium]
MNLKQLAESLGLSQTTVSRALNGYPEVSETTRSRVLAAAERVGYRPNTRAKALATGRSMMIGHVIHQSDRHEMLNPIFADFIAGASEEYSVHGYDIILSIAQDGDDERVYRDMAAKGSVDGLILHSPKRDEPRIPLLQEIGLPFVVHGRSSDVTSTYSFVDVDNRRSFQRATDFLSDLGHSRIALINGLEHMDFAHRRRRGYISALEGRGIRPDPALMFSGEMTEAHGFEATRQLLELVHPPTAILSASPITAFGVRRAAESRGLTLGSDISVITHDDDLSYFRNGGDAPIFTALRSSVRIAGRRAAESLIDLIDRPGEARQTMLETDFLIGASTGPAPSAPRLRKA